MTGSPTAPTLSTSDKLLTDTYITSLVPVKIDVDKLNYSSWCYYFKKLCQGYDVIKHIQSESTSEGVIPPPTSEWLKADSIVIMDFSYPLGCSSGTSRGC